MKTNRNQNEIVESKKMCKQEENKIKKGKGFLYVGSPIAWAARGAKRSIGCRDRLICREGRVRAGPMRAAHWLHSVCPVK